MVMMRRWDVGEAVKLIEQEGVTVIGGYVIPAFFILVDMMANITEFQRS